jgi:hypothetical protein
MQLRFNTTARLPWETIGYADRETLQSPECGMPFSGPSKMRGFVVFLRDRR